MPKAKAKPAEGFTETSAVELETSTVDQLYLYAFATQREVSHHLRTRISTSANLDQEEILKNWRQVQPKVKAVIDTEQRLAEGINFSNLDPKDSPALMKIASSPMLKKSYSATSYRFAVVNVDRLIAPQRQVNLFHVQKIQKRVPKNAGLNQLIEVCLTASGIEPIQHMEVGQNFHVFSSPSTDLRFLGAFRKELRPEDLNYAEIGGTPAAAVVAFVGYGAPEVNVFEVGNKMVLNNGFHRVYALRAMGFKELPVLVKEIKNPSLEMPGTVLGVSSGYLLNHPRPALLKDFLDPDFSVKLKVPKKVRTVKVRVAGESHDVPV